MPLPFAPPPSQSKVYADLKNIKLTDLTSDEFDLLKGALFAQGVDSSEDEMRRLNLVGQASNQQSTSGPIPGSMVIDVMTETSSGYYDVFTPGPNEVWGICSLNWETKNADSISFYYNDGSNRARITYMGATGPDLGNELPSILYITQPVTLELYIGGATGSNVATCARIRVR